MSRRAQIDARYIEQSVTDADHEYRKGRGPSRDDEPVDYERNTIRDPEADAAPDDWTPKRIERRLVEAAQVTEAIVGRVGPAGARGFWPETLVQFHEEVGQVEQGTHLIGKNRVRLQATTQQVSRAEKALGWAKRYVTDEDALRTFNAWLGLKARPRRRFDEREEKWVRVTWAWSCANERGWALATADRNRDRAKQQIIEGLRRDGVKAI